MTELREVDRKGFQMHQYVAETFVAVADAPCVAEAICTRIRDFCGAIVTEGSDWLLTFEDGRAIIRSTGDGLFFWVSARNLVTVYGIRTLIEGSLWKFASSSARSIKWFPAEAAPFPAVDKRLTYSHCRMNNP
ncbi:SMa0974 family conjugal transfer regulator [Rhizobium vallis]|uniref:SMa0974 family conjugal transfer regulator n=1 Tax=Rhizobium vallis TaxID=634290 RepID=UPI001ABF88C3|nr:hypothetical protein [Rhizobium vallis]